jgi:hypothetical protein
MFVVCACMEAAAKSARAGSRSAVFFMGDEGAGNLLEKTSSIRHPDTVLFNFF